MPKDREKEEITSNEGIAAYVGISAPETPKYLLTNNFLTEYFRASGDRETEYTYQRFMEQKTLYTEDEENEKLLEQSFNRFLTRYLGEETIRTENTKLPRNKHFYFPITQEMLTGSTANLRHILYHLQRLDDRFDYAGMQRKLKNYIFKDKSGINHILKILFQSQDLEAENQAEAEIQENFWRLFRPSEKSRLTRLGQRLNEDLDVLLTHDYFLKLDFYRRYQYLSILLTSYVIQYIVVRKDGNTGILCKGNPLDNRLNGMIHRACCSNYADIRGFFPSLLQQYYIETLKEMTGNDETLQLYAENDCVTINNMTFQEFVINKMGSKARSEIEYQRLVKAFALKEGKIEKMPVEDFVLRYIDLTRTRRGSTLTKISSALSTSGKQIEMVYPRSNAKQKYFAMSASLTEFYVRLYLASKNRQYDYLDNFIEYLQTRYRIVITKSDGSEKLMKAIKPKLSAQELAKNKEAFLDTLNSVNCLIKLSDSGYVVTLPEEKGDFRLI